MSTPIRPNKKIVQKWRTLGQFTLQQFCCDQKLIFTAKNCISRWSQQNCCSVNEPLCLESMISCYVININITQQPCTHKPCTHKPCKHALVRYSILSAVKLKYILLVDSISSLITKAFMSRVTRLGNVCEVMMTNFHTQPN